MDFAYDKNSMSERNSGEICIVRMIKKRALHTIEENDRRSEISLAAKQTTIVQMQDSSTW